MLQPLNIKFRYKKTYCSYLLKINLRFRGVFSKKPSKHTLLQVNSFPCKKLTRKDIVGTRPTT